MRGVLDAGALIALERGDRAVGRKLDFLLTDDADLVTNAAVLAQVWRGGSGRQAQLARALRPVYIDAVTESVGFAAGLLLELTGTSDAIDATLALMVGEGDVLLTSDVDDLAILLDALGRRATVVLC